MSERERAAIARHEDGLGRIRVTFDAEGDFQAMRDAEAWCQHRGISVGPTQRGEPRGLMYGDYSIAKWRNLTLGDRVELDGTMTGSMRHGPIVIEICERPEEVAN